MKYDLIYSEFGKKYFIEENKEHSECEQILQKMQGKKKYEKGILMISEHAKQLPESIFYLTLDYDSFKQQLKEWLNVQPFAEVKIPNIKYHILEAFKMLQKSGYGQSMNFRIELGTDYIKKVQNSL